jgi:molecular chaperone HscC
LVLRAFQGEAPLVKDNVLLGELTIKLPPGPATKQHIDVRFTYDTSGLLEVQATILSSGRGREAGDRRQSGRDAA